MLANVRDLCTHNRHRHIRDQYVIAVGPGGIEVFSQFEPS